MQEYAQDGPTPLPDGDNAVPAEQQAVLAEPVDWFEVSVLDELEKIRNPGGNEVQTLVARVRFEMPSRDSTRCQSFVQEGFLARIAACEIEPCTIP